jgi:hypothetical protein
MRKLVSLLVASCAVVGLASGCAVEAPLDEQESTGSDHLALMNCSNPEGTNAMIAALAVAIASELGRWNVTTDFQKATNANWQTVLALSPTGQARCSSRGHSCQNIKALLFFQDTRYDNYIRFPGNVKLSAHSYVSRLIAGFDAQKICEDRAKINPPKPGQVPSSDTCYAEEHLLTLTGTAPGGCDMNFTYNATTPSGGLLTYPQLLKNKLIWANDGGSAQVLNPYVQFTSTARSVTVDPTWGLDEDGQASGGSCLALCQKYDKNKVWTGECCSCNGMSAKFAPGATANVYKCSTSN